MEIQKEWDRKNAISADSEKLTTQLITSGHKGDSRDTISAGAAPKNQKNPIVNLKDIDWSVNYNIH